MTSEYLAAASSATAELREKGSRFLAVVRPATSEEAVRSLLAELRRQHPDATHHCWAYRLGDPPREASSDAGEPAGTAGAPILNALRRRGLSDVAAVVVRWFGGVKLGKGGLARAYAAAARAALEGVEASARIAMVEVVIEVPFERVGAVKRLLRPGEIELAAEEYGTSARLLLRVSAERQAELEEALAQLGARVDGRETTGSPRERRP